MLMYLDHRWRDMRARLKMVPSNRILYDLLAISALSLLLTARTLIYLNAQSQLQHLEMIQSTRSQIAALKIDAYLDDAVRKVSYLLPECLARTRRSTWPD